MTATETDFELAWLYQSQLRMGADPGMARAFAMGRSVQSARAFDEAIARAEETVLALGPVARMRESFRALGNSESTARAQALEYGWDRIEEARRGSPPAPAGDLDEGRRPGWASGKRRVRTVPASAVVESIELTEVGESQDQLRSAFSRLGLSDGAAADAAAGR